LSSPNRDNSLRKYRAIRGMKFEPDPDMVEVFDRMFETHKAILTLVQSAAIDAIPQ
jgi:hypothetical protein